MPGKKNKRQDPIDEMNKKLKTEERLSTTSILDLPDSIIGWIISLVGELDRLHIGWACKRLHVLSGLNKRFETDDEVKHEIHYENKTAVYNFLMNPYSDLTILAYSSVVSMYQDELLSGAIASKMISKDTKVTKKDDAKDSFFEYLCKKVDSKSHEFARQMLRSGSVVDPRDGFVAALECGNLSMYNLAHMKVPYTDLNFWVRMANAAYTKRLIFPYNDIVKRVPNIVTRLLSVVSDNLMEFDDMRIISDRLPNDPKILIPWLNMAIKRRAYVFISDILSRERTKQLFQHCFNKAFGLGDMEVLDYLCDLSNEMFEWDNRIEDKKGEYIIVDLKKEDLLKALEKDAYILNSLMRYESFDINMFYFDIMRTIIEYSDFDMFKKIFQHTKVTDRKEGLLLMEACRLRDEKAVSFLLREKWDIKRDDMTLAFFHLCSNGGLEYMKLFNEVATMDGSFGFWGGHDEVMLLTHWIQMCLSNNGAEAEALYILMDMTHDHEIHLCAESLLGASLSFISLYTARMSDIMEEDGILFVKAVALNRDNKCVLGVLLSDERAIFEDSEPHKFIREIFRTDNDGLFIILLDDTFYQKLAHMIPAKVIFDLCIEYSSTKILDKILNARGYNGIDALFTEQVLESLGDSIDEYFMTNIKKTTISTMLIEKYGKKSPWIAKVFAHAVNERKLMTALVAFKTVDDIMRFGNDLYEYLKIVAEINVWDRSFYARDIIPILNRADMLLHLFRLCAILDNTDGLSSIIAYYNNNVSWLKEEIFPALRIACIRGNVSAFDYLSSLEGANLSEYANHLLRYCRDKTILRSLYKNKDVKNEILVAYDDKYLQGLDKDLKDTCDNILSLYGFE